METWVTEMEASIQFNNSKRAAIKDHIKHIEQSQKEQTTGIQQISEKQPMNVLTCECSQRLDQLELTAGKKNMNN